MLFDITQTPNDPESAISGYKVSLTEGRLSALMLVPSPGICPLDRRIHRPRLANITRAVCGDILLTSQIV